MERFQDFVTAVSNSLGAGRERFALWFCLMYGRNESCLASTESETGSEGYAGFTVFVASQEFFKARKAATTATAVAIFTGWDVVRPFGRGSAAGCGGCVWDWISSSSSMDDTAILRLRWSVKTAKEETRRKVVERKREGISLLSSIVASKASKRAGHSRLIFTWSKFGSVFLDSRSFHALLLGSLSALEERPPTCDFSSLLSMVTAWSLSHTCDFSCSAPEKRPSCSWESFSHLNVVVSSIFGERLIAWLIGLPSTSWRDCFTSLGGVDESIVSLRWARGWDGAAFGEETKRCETANLLWNASTIAYCLIVVSVDAFARNMSCTADSVYGSIS
ncbi:hypothetical protein HHK36_000878 [Tetracentron sinense]|uniref:Uncharacterized protein n=1 Tax=Tetracentron sinense TaxID=13715 RepID=A0A835DR40_TETSI|nr:hypothetical protein HHK36_000878 [Tetracentron sinense]